MKGMKEFMQDDRFMRIEKPGMDIHATRWLIMGGARMVAWGTRHNSYGSHTLQNVRFETDMIDNIELTFDRIDHRLLGLLLPYMGENHIPSVVSEDERISQCAPRKGEIET